MTRMLDVARCEHVSARQSDGWFSRDACGRAVAARHPGARTVRRRGSAFARFNPAEKIDGARAIRDGELAEKRRDVTTGGRGGDAESGGPLARRGAVGPGVENLPLAGADRCGRGGGGDPTTRAHATPPSP